MTPLDYDPPTHRLNEVLFDVSLEPVFSKFQLSDELFPNELTADQYRAVVNQNTRQVISIVSRSYELIKNKKALELGKEVFLQLYPKLNINELIPYKVIAPKSLASVHIDLIHKDVNFDIWEQENWLPFLRISNSYNRTYALSFEVGFVKKLCSNGVLFNKRSMKLKYIHEKNRHIRLKNDTKDIILASKQFGKQCSQLRDYGIPEDFIFPLLCQILKINLDISNERLIRNKIKLLEKLKCHVNEEVRSYQQYLGLNAYTIFNVATDLVSHNDKYNIFPGYYFNVRSFFTRPTDWMEDFLEKIDKNDLDLEKYLEPTMKKLTEFSKETGFRCN
jgi:hypothetical protein